MLRMTSYAPLVSYLRTLPPNVPGARLAYAEIEILLGRLLPRGAWLSHFWSGGRLARRHWGAVGFRAALDRPACAVVFTRQPPCSVPGPPRADGRRAGVSRRRGR